MPRLYGIAAFLIGLPVVSLAQQATPATDVSGKWSLIIRTPDGPQPRTLDLVMSKDGGVSGWVGSPMGSVSITSGRLADSTLHIGFAMAGGEIRVTYEITVRHDTLHGVYRQDRVQGALLGVRGDRPVQFPPQEAPDAPASGGPSAQPPVLRPANFADARPWPHRPERSTRAQSRPR